MPNLLIIIAKIAIKILSTWQKSDTLSALYVSAVVRVRAVWGQAMEAMEQATGLYPNIHTSAHW